MIFYIKLFFTFFKLNLKAQMEYRINFIMSIFQISILQLGNLGLIWVVLDSFQALREWTFGEIAFLVGLRLLSHGLFTLFLPEINWGLSNYIVRGEFDKFLLKPVNPLFLLITNGIVLSGITDFSSGIVILWIATKSLGLNWTFINLLLLLIVVFSGLLIELSAYLATSSVAFWVTNLQTLNFITFQFHEQYILYPVSIYGKPIQYFLTFIIPFAFINFYPSAYFLNKPSSLLFHPYFVYLTPIVALISFGVAYFIWKRGILAYQSTGS